MGKTRFLASRSQQSVLLTGIYSCWVPRLHRWASPCLTGFLWYQAGLRTGSRPRACVRGLGQLLLSAEPPCTARPSGHPAADDLPVLRLSLFNLAEAWVFAFLPMMLADRRGSSPLVRRARVASLHSD